MSLVLTALLFLFLSTANVNAAPLHGLEIVNTGAYVCNGENHTQFWAAPEHMYVTNVMAVTVNAPGGLMLLSGCDCYANPSAPRQVNMDFAPHYFEVQAGESIQVNYHCNKMGSQGSAGRGGPHAHHAVHVWWTTEQP